MQSFTHSVSDDLNGEILRGQRNDLPSFPEEQIVSNTNPDTSSATDNSLRKDNKEIRYKSCLRLVAGNVSKCIILF